MAHKTFCDRCNKEIKPRRIWRDAGIYNIDCRYGLVEDDEGNKVVEKICPKKNPHNDAEKLVLNFPYGTIAFNEYCKSEVNTMIKHVATADNFNWVFNSWEIEDDSFINGMHPQDITISITGHAKTPTPNHPIPVYIPIGDLIDDVLKRMNGTNTTNTEISVSYSIVNPYTIKNVIFNPPATIVFWGDGSKTVVKCQDGEEFDPEKGLTMAFFKRMHDNKGRYFEDIKKWVGKDEG